MGVLLYNQNKVDLQKASVLDSNKIRQTWQGDYNVSLSMKSFDSYLTANKKTEKPILHISINPHPDDKLTDEQLSTIAKEYMEKMGLGNQPYLVYKHEDIDRHHIHIVSVNVDETGKQINNYNDYKKSKSATRELEKKYNLLPAEKNPIVDAISLKRVDPKAGEVKKQVSNTVKGILKTYRFGSIAEFRALLSLYGVTVEEVKGEIREKAYTGLVYSALDDKNKKTGNPFKASLIGKVVGHQAVQNRMEYSKKYMKENPVYDRTKVILSGLLKQRPSRKKLVNELNKQGVSVIFRENEDKRIYGVTFVDHRQKAVFTGSKLGKEFSANAFNDLFKISPTEILYQTPDTYDGKDKDSAIEAVAGLFSKEQQGEDYEEIAFANRMKRKKRKPQRPRL